MPLPPGEYEIFQVRFLGPMGGSAATMENAQSMSLPLRIEENKELYMGELIASGIRRKAALLGKIVVGYRFDISDRRERDFAVLKRKFPEFSPADAAVVLPARAIVLLPPKLAIVPTDAPPEGS
jgi:hypothetical protein